ncbi:MAG: hypothetical protein JRH16_07855 [Deltaproteobacteria bacterium]|nr:hypothetical protein [Deltaproteobacteria bacterium]MBW2363190.1 hypothetical protein [Deltaproteobacteria bacterium]
MSDASHPDDKIHTPTSDDPFWSETWWFDISVPERNLSAQFSVFARTNQGVCMSSAYVWDGSGDELSNCLYQKILWHLPLPEGDLVDLSLPNGMRMRCSEPTRGYRIQYQDPDDGYARVDLSFTGIHEPNYLGDAHLDQLGSVRGEIQLGDQTIPVAGFGMRDRSWHVRPQMGGGFHGGGAGHSCYSYGAASESSGFHIVGFDSGEGDCDVIGGYLLRDGVVSKLASGQRRVVERAGHAPTRLLIEASDEKGRHLHAEGRCANRLHFMMYPNLLAWNCLTEWQLDDGQTAWGEDRDNWTSAGMRRFRRETPGS